MNRRVERKSLNYDLRIQFKGENLEPKNKKVTDKVIEMVDNSVMAIS